MTERNEATAPELTPRQRINAVRHRLDQLCPPISEMQRDFHRDMMRACAKLIFEHEADSDELDKLLAELRVDPSLFQEK